MSTMLLGTRWAARSGVLSMKEGRVSSVVSGSIVSWLVGGGFEFGSFLYCTLVWGDELGWSCSGSAIRFGAVMRPRTQGACRSKRLSVAEHVPDRFGEAAGDLDGGDLGAAVAAVAGAHALADGGVVGVAGGAVRGFDQCPAQVVGAVLAQRAAAVAFAGLVDAGAEAGVAGQLARAGEAADVADLGGDRERQRPADAGAGEQERDVAVVGAEGAQFPLAAGDAFIEGVDQGERGGDRRRPWLGQRELVEQPPAAGAEQIAVAVGDAMLEQDRVDAVFERAAA